MSGVVGVHRVDGLGGTVRAQEGRARHITREGVWGRDGGVGSMGVGCDGRGWWGGEGG